MAKAFKRCNCFVLELCSTLGLYQDSIKISNFFTSVSFPESIIEDSIIIGTSTSDGRLSTIRG